MKSRCSNKKNEHYHIYGGRGISVCQEWRSNFRVFAEWSKSNGYRNGLQIDRIDNNCGYSPTNCRWVDCKTNSRNRRDNILLTAFGETKCIAEWVEDPRCVICETALRYRVNSGWDHKEAITKKSKSALEIEAFGASKTLSEWAKETGIHEMTIHKRIKLGWDAETALTKPLGKAVRKKTGRTFLVAFGETKSLTQWLEDARCVVTREALSKRLRRGWTAEQSITMPAGTKLFHKERLEYEAV